MKKTRLGLLLRRGLSISCRRATELLSLAQDTKLSFLQKLRLRLHLAICDSCTRFSQQLDLLHRAVQHHTHYNDHNGDENITMPLPEDVRRQIQEKISSSL